MSIIEFLMDFGAILDLIEIIVQLLSCGRFPISINGLNAWFLCWLLLVPLKLADLPSQLHHLVVFLLHLLVMIRLLLLHIDVFLLKLTSKLIFSFFVMIPKLCKGDLLSAFLLHNLILCISPPGVILVQKLSIGLSFINVLTAAIAVRIQIIMLVWQYLVVLCGVVLANEWVHLPELGEVFIL